ncbi:MAG TPA: signal peptidase II [Steroidobacteraceae bacterium]|nr:signal peptidase II [Steroidobacteraceae bacterium]
MKRTTRIALILVTLLGCVGCDQVTKAVAREQLAPGTTISLLHDLVRLERYENPGAFLSLGEDWPTGVRRALFTAGGLLWIAGVLGWALRTRHARPTAILGAALVASGGLGNVIDRLAHAGRVTDFLNVGIDAIRTGIFNVADMTLLLGLALLIVGVRESGPREP